MKIISTLLLIVTVYAVFVTYRLAEKSNDRQDTIKADTVIVTIDCVKTETKWLMATKEKIILDVSDRDSLLVELARRDSAFNQEIIEMDDSVEVWSTIDSYERGYDTVIVATKFYGKPIETFKQKVLWSPERYVKVTEYEYIDKKEKFIQFKPAITFGVDSHAKPNVVAGVGITLNF